MANHSQSRTKRVFLNNIDTYSSKYIAQVIETTSPLRELQ